LGRDKPNSKAAKEMGKKSMELKKLNGLRDKLRFKKSSAGSEEETLVEYPSEGVATTSQDRETAKLTEKLKAAFHEKPKEDKSLQERKELDEKVRGFRKSFRKDVATGVKQRVDVVVTEVKQQITNIKDATKSKKKEKDDEEPSDLF